MKKIIVLVLSCAWAFPTNSFAQTGHTEVLATRAVRKGPPTFVTPKSGFILRQDLFDRNNPNNLRSDWPAPPAQPGG
jgi:hypothetical protein